MALTEYKRSQFLFFDFLLKKKQFKLRAIQGQMHVGYVIWTEENEVTYDKNSDIEIQYEGFSPF